MPYSVGMVSLGCEKNRVDAEMMMAALEQAGYELKDDAALADVAIVNTCGFIEDAKKESIEEILELARLKKEGRIRALVVTGCMAERYREEVRREIPEADAVCGIGANGDIAAVVAQALAGEHPELFPEKCLLPLEGRRVRSTPSYFAYLKIAEGCDNRCSYCAIPMIRGGYRSRTMESIVQEAEQLAAEGAKELILIAQDTTRYGKDLYGRYALPELLRRLCAVEGPRWIRLLYCYPEAITDELLDVMAAEKKIVKYMDLPLQHCSQPVLRAMRRAGSRQELTALLRKLRQRIPGLVLRTTMITGFPGETEEDFEELCQFAKEMRFERLGCFAYSQEEGTPAGAMENQVEPEVRQERRNILMEQQMNIMQEWGESRVGQTVEVLVEGFDRYAECWFGRSAADAPDVDGKIFFLANGKRPRLGEFRKIKITDCIDCDLMGEIVG
ncbi:MAG TPA: 30S ribosomal protein S12 methylthiotransferase RimO [Candidatus Caccousia avistercoris]|nr:30S ribosomal protein S12 methylthiotransferase RimO [Candidatus Caccousia avistercoris]